MAGKSSSLLTKTQRRRIRNGFEDLEEEKKFRDQKRIRERITSGILDFQLLQEYPDRQFELAFDDIDTEELNAALADAYIVNERIRVLNGIDRPAIIETAQQRVEDSDDTRELASLDNVNLTTKERIEAETREELETQFRRSPWETRANALLKIGAGSFIPLLLMTFLDEYFFGDLVARFSIIILSLVLFGVMCLIGWFLIVVVRIVLDVAPSARKIISTVT